MLTQTQHAVITEVVRKLEKGPHGGWAEVEGPSANDLAAFGPMDARQFRIWIETWITEPLQLILENSAGNVSAAELAPWGRR